MPNANRVILLLSFALVAAALPFSGSTLHAYRYPIAAMRRGLIPPTSRPIQSEACHGNSTLIDLSSLPPALDARVQWPALFHPSPNPDPLCDPLAYVLATIFSDVTSIALNTKLTFSAQELISCANYSCGEGGWPNNGLLYMTKQGLPSEACYPLSGSETSEARALASVFDNDHALCNTVVTFLFSANPAVQTAAPKLQARAG